MNDKRVRPFDQTTTIIESAIQCILRKQTGDTESVAQIIAEPGRIPLQ